MSYISQKIKNGITGKIKQEKMEFKRLTKFIINTY